MPNYAIVIGINQYPDETGQPELFGAVADACDFADWALADDGGAVPPQNLYLWPHPWPTPVEATQSVHDFLNAPTPFAGPYGPITPAAGHAPIAKDIVKTAMTLAQRLVDEGADRAQQRIYIFFAGHGVRTIEPHGEPQTFFVARDFSNDDLQYAEGLVACDTLRRALLGRAFGEVFMFLDCCRVQDPLLPIPALALCHTGVEDGSLPWGVGHAAQENQRAFETEGDEPRGAFSLALVEGLRTHRNAVTRGLDFGELRNFVLERIVTKDRQRPDFRSNPSAAPYPVIFPEQAPPSPPAAIVLDLSALPAGSHVQLVDGARNPVPGWSNIPASPDPVVIPNRAPGLYKVQRLDGPHAPQYFEHPDAGIVRVD